MPLVKGIPPDFHRHFRTFVRLEPRCRSDDFAQGLEACTADPLWFLARQWQTGEFQGEDAGSPLSVRLQYASQSIDHVRLSEAAGRVSLTEAPLEMQVEQEPSPLTWRSRAQIGQQFERLLKAILPLEANDLIEGYRQEFELARPAGQQWAELDVSTQRFLRLMAGRVIDGQQLLQALERSQLIAPAGVDGSLFEQAVQALGDWHGRLYGRPPAGAPQAWRSQQLDYRFELNPPQFDGPSKTRLVAPDYRNGDLDWYTFAADRLRDPWPAQAPITVNPTRITVGGTSPRWWAFEDSATDFGKLDVAKPDLAKLLLMEFVLIYGDDWFSVPLTAQMGQLVRIDDLCVCNVFGEDTPVQSVRQNVQDRIADNGWDLNEPTLRWEMFTLSPLTSPAHPGVRVPEAPGVGDALLLLPVAGYRQESAPVEELWFARDEGANMVWAIEQTVLNGIGRPVSGFDAQRERFERRTAYQIGELESQLEGLQDKLSRGDLSEDEVVSLEEAAAIIQEDLDRLREADRPVSTDLPRYRLATAVPENWHPFIPRDASQYLNLPNKSIQLRRAQMLLNVSDTALTVINSLTRLLGNGAEPLIWLEETAVPRAGRRVTLNYQRVRWFDGQTYVWLGRKALIGRGESRSGLAFDVLDF